jgi:DNA-binding transcriptional MerR regulator
MKITFTIKDLSQLTRIKPHTLRIWEQRYGILKPKRSDANIRQYDQEELKYLLNVAILNENGYKISHIAKLSQEQLSAEVKTTATSDSQYSTPIQGLVVAMLELDEQQFNLILNSNIESIGMEDTIVKIVYPFLQHIGILWQTNTINPAQEHFITNLIRQKLIVAIDGITFTSLRSDCKKFMLFLPEGEMHEISLLFACYLIKLSGHKCIYLGQSLPINDVAAVQESHHADVIFTIITSTPCHEAVQPYINKLNEVLSGTQIWLTGYQIFSQELFLPDNFLAIRDVFEMRKLLNN